MPGPRPVVLAGHTLNAVAYVFAPPGSHRGGILSMAAVLAVSSYPQRTSPVLRGKWILETILGTPPPPPPANVPAHSRIVLRSMNPR